MQKNISFLALKNKKKRRPNFLLQRRCSLNQGLLYRETFKQQNLQNKLNLRFLAWTFCLLTFLHLFKDFFNLVILLFRLNKKFIFRILK